MRKFKGWHIVAGLAAVAVAIPLGSLMGLKSVAAFMFAGVAFVAVAFWVDHKLARRRTIERDSAKLPLGDSADN